MKTVVYSNRESARNALRELKGLGVSCLSQPEKDENGQWYLPFKGGLLSLNK